MRFDVFTLQFGEKKHTRAHMPSHMLINEKKCFQVSFSVRYL